LFCTCERTQDDLVVQAPYAMAVLNGKNLTHDPPRTELWALLYAQVRQADGKDYRNILLDDRKLTFRRRVSRGLDPATGLIRSGFENEDAPARAEIQWTQEEVLAALRNLGLPADSSLSVLCVEMMPTLQSLRAPQVAEHVDSIDFGSSIVADRSGFGDPAGASAQDYDLRPLTDGLGHYRILRTSPLTPVPEICCVGCA